MKKSDDDTQGQDRKSSIAPKEDIKIVTKNKKMEETEVSMTDHNKFRKKELWTYTVTLLNLIADASFEQPIEKQVLHRQPLAGEKSLISINVVSAFFKNYKEEDVSDDSADGKAAKANNNIFEPFLKLAHYYIKEQNDGPRRLERNQTVIVWDEGRTFEEMQSFIQENQGSEGGIDQERMQLFQMVIAFFTYLFNRELQHNKYNIKRLRTIETSLDFIKTIMRTQNDVPYPSLINSIIMSVMKLKWSVIYQGVDLKALRSEVEKKHLQLLKHIDRQKEMDRPRNLLTAQTEENNNDDEPPAVIKLQEKKEDIFEAVDKRIETNYKKVVGQKEKLRLLIDTRSRAAEILDIYLDIQNNKRLSMLVNDVFLKLYKNDFDTGEDGNEPYSHRYKMVHEDTWVKEIIKICSTNTDDRLRDVRCLIECIFVDSLKVVDKMIVLMFKMYESRQLLLKAFSNTFICYERFYVDAYNEVKAWMASFEKIKENGDFSASMKQLQNFSYMLRNPMPKRKKRKYVAEDRVQSDDAFGDGEQYTKQLATKRSLTGDEQIRIREQEQRKDMEFEQRRKRQMETNNKRETLVLNERQTRFTRRQEQLQKLFINIKIHQFVLKYAKALKPNSDTAGRDLDTIYEFLTLLVFDSSRNKSVLLQQPKNLDIWEKHIKLNYKAVDFLREMVRNNKSILFNKELVVRIVRMVLELSIEKDDYVLRAKLLEVLRVCCMYNNRVHADNQTIILSLLQNKKYFDRVMFSSINYALCRKIDRTPVLMDVFNVFHNGVPNTLHTEESDEDIRYLTDLEEELRVQEPEPVMQEEEENNAMPTVPELLEEEEKPQPPSNYTMLTTYLTQYRNAYDQACKSRNTDTPIAVHEMLQYVISFFSLMTALVDESHKINVGKCSNIHPYDTLLVLLEDSQMCWPLARYVRAYINRLYYENFTEKSTDVSGPFRSNSQVSIQRELKLKTEFFLDKIFEDELPLLSEHLREVSMELHDPKSLFIVEQVRISRPVRYEYVVSYLYMYFVQTLSGLKSILSSHQFKNVVSEKLKENGANFQAIFAGLVQTVGDIYKRYRHINQEPYVKKILTELFDLSAVLIEKLDINQFQQPDMKLVVEMQSYPEAEPEEEKKLQRQSLCQTRRRLLYNYFIQERDDRTNKRDVKDDPEDLFLEEFNNLRLNPKANHSRTDSDEEVQLQVNDLLQSVISRIRNTDKIKQMAEDELNELVELCCDLDCRSNIATIPLLLDGRTIDEPRVLYKVISENVFLQQVIKLVTRSPDHLQTSVKIKTIRFLRLIFEKKVNSKCGLSGKRKWESSYFKKGLEKEVLEEVQGYFKRLKLGEMIVKILQTDNAGYELLMETFMIGVCFLFNGNSKCQESILIKLQENSENEVMTQLCQFIRNIRNDIETEKFQAQQKMEIKPEDSKKNEDKQVVDQRRTMTDSYNYYDKELNCMVQSREDKDTTSQSFGEVSKKIKCVCQAYNFLQLLCENDNTALKDFLRQQINVDKSTKYNSVNFLAETTKLFKIVLEKLATHEKQKYLIEDMTEFIIEVTQIPCITNQRQLCNTSIFQDIRSYIDKELSSSSERLNESVLYLMDFVINVGLSLLEGNEDSIYDNLLKSLDAKFLRIIYVEQNKKLKDLKEHNAECPTIEQINEQTLRVLMKDDQSNSNKEIRTRLEYVFNLLALIKKLSHYQTRRRLKPTLLCEMTSDNRENRQLGKYKPDVVKNLCTNYIEHIEVAHDGKKQYLYFPKLPIFSQISIETQEYINENVKRDTQIDKITDFLSKSYEVNNEMNWNYKVQNRLNSSSKTLDQLRRNITILTLLIEIVFIVFSTIDFTLNREKKEVVKMIRLGWVSSLLHFLAIIQLFSSVYFLYVWVTLKYRLAVEREVQKNKTDLNIKFVESMLIKIDKDEQFDLRHYWYCAKLMYEHETEIYNTLFFVLTSFSGYLFGYQYYSLMVFDILSRNKTLKNVIQAITLNMKQLFYVSLLILVFVYVFNMISIEFDLYLPYIYEAEEEKCQVLSDCIMSLYTSGIVGTKDQDLRLGRYFTDLLYIVIMELLFSNIVSGIMIDTFAQLRDHRKLIENDQQNRCFICGITKATIEKRMKEQADENSDEYFNNPNNKGIFHYHTHNIHKQWNYIYYLYILKQKDITAYTGIEYAIKKQLNDDQFKWVPIEYEKNENDVDELLDLLSQKLKKRMDNGGTTGH